MSNKTTLQTNNSSLEDIIELLNKLPDASENADGYPVEIDDMSKADLTAIGKVYKYVGDTNDTYTNGCLYIVEEN